MPVGIVWELYQQYQIRDAKSEAEAARSTAVVGTVSAQMLFPQIEALRRRRHNDARTESLFDQPSHELDRLVGGDSAADADDQCMPRGGGL